MIYFLWFLFLIGLFLVHKYFKAKGLMRYMVSFLLAIPLYVIIGINIGHCARIYSFPFGCTVDDANTVESILLLQILIFCTFLGINKFKKLPAK